MKPRHLLLTKDADGGFAGGGPRILDFPFHIETKDVSADGQFEGYASVWGVVDQGGDAVQPGAFTEGLVKAKQQRRLIPMLWQHDRRIPIGVWQEMAEDQKGLRVKGQLLIGDGTPANPGVAQAREAYALLKAGALGGLSIGYRVPVGGMEEDKNRRGVWLLKKLDLVEVSLVTLPMLVEAKVTAVKNILDAGRLPTVREFEGFLVASGFSRGLAEGISGKAAPLLRGEPDGGGDDAGNSFWTALDALTRGGGLLGRSEG